MTEGCTRKRGAHCKKPDAPRERSSIAVRAACERWYPLVLSAAAAGFAAKVVPSFGLGGQLLSGIMGAAAAQAGFVGIMAVLLTATDTPAVRFMKRVRKFGTLLGYLRFSVMASLAFLVISAVIQLAGFTEQPLAPVGLCVRSAWLFCGALSVLSAYRAVSASMTLMRGAGRDG